jgi:DNA (cytosine-5)-methyltransferase 1
VQNVDNPKELKTISLCSGYGGIERGIELTGTRVKHIVTCEIEAYAIANSIARMERGELEAHPIYTDCKTFPTSAIPKGSVDLITGGYPCQPFSEAGKKRGSDDHRHLWPYIKGIINEVRPKLCFFENVEGHIRNGLREVIRDLESIGYKTSWGIFSAQEIGAPHQRKRVFIMAQSESGGAVRGKGNVSLQNEKLPTQKEPRENERTKSDMHGGLGNSRSFTSFNWPAGPGDEQYHYEPKRAVVKNKPIVGRANDGVEHWDDRLKMLGNGVVPQVAALAWETLLNKQDS